MQCTSKSSLHFALTDNLGEFRNRCCSTGKAKIGMVSESTYFSRDDDIFKRGRKFDADGWTYGIFLIENDTELRFCNQFYENCMLQGV